MVTYHGKIRKKITSETNPKISWLVFSTHLKKYESKWVHLLQFCGVNIKNMKETNPEIVVKPWDPKIWVFPKIMVSPNHQF